MKERMLTWLFGDMRFITEQFFKEEREKHMAKKPAVKFTGGEYKPKRLASGLIGLRLPLNLEVPVGAAIDINFYMTCDHSLLINKGVVDAGENIAVKITNTTGDVLRYVAGDVVSRAYPLIAQDFEVV